MDRHAPSKDEVLESRWLRPFGARVRASELWRFTRRSVPRGVFAGLFVGIFLMIPGLQIVGAALLAIPMRANIPIAAAMTFLSNPATTPFFLIASLKVGSLLGFRADLASFEAMRARHAAIKGMGSMVMDRRCPGDGVGPAGDRPCRGACRIYRVACRMALVDRAQMAATEQ
jgi:hypothetical protein